MADSATSQAFGVLRSRVSKARVAVPEVVGVFKSQISDVAERIRVIIKFSGEVLFFRDLG